MYISKKDQMDRREVVVHIASLEEGRDISIETLVSVHYAFHRDDDDFDGGLSLFDHLYRKLRLFYDIEWDLELIKENIKKSSNQEESYYDTLKSLLTPEMVGFYGI